MSELIVAGFGDPHTAFLARAALARLQKEIPVGGYDVAVVTLEENGGVTVPQVIGLRDSRPATNGFLEGVDWLPGSPEIGRIATPAARRPWRRSESTTRLWPDWRERCFRRRLQFSCWAPSRRETGSWASCAVFGGKIVIYCPALTGKHGARRRPTQVKEQQKGSVSE